MAQQMEILGPAGAPGLWQARQNGLLGIWKEQEGLLVLGDWESIGQYREGRAMVFKTDSAGKKRWGLIDERGRVITPCQWYYETEPPYPDLAFCSNGEFVNGYALARENDGAQDCYRILTREGKLIGDRCWAYVEELFGEERNPIRVFSRNDNNCRAISYVEDYLYEEPPAHWLDGELVYEKGCYYLCYDGTVLTPTGAVLPGEEQPLPEGWEDEPKDLSAFTGSYVCSDGRLYLNRAGQLCFGRPQGEETLWWDEIRYPEARGNNIRYDLRLVRSGKYWGLADARGALLLDCRWDSISPEQEDLVLVTRDGMYGMHTEKGEEVVPCCMEALCTGSSILAKQNGLWGAFDLQGRQVVPFRWEEIACQLPGFRVAEGGKWGLLDETGEQILPCRYDAMDMFRFNLLKVQLDGLWGLMDRNMQPVTPCMWREIRVEYGRILVRKGGKWGLLNADGSTLTEVLWEQITVVFDKSFIVKRAGKYGVLDPKGNILLPCEYDMITQDYDVQEFVLCRDGKYGTATYTGDLRIPCQWDEIRFPYDRQRRESFVRVRKDGQYFDLDLQGNPRK